MKNLIGLAIVLASIVTAVASNAEGTRKAHVPQCTVQYVLGGVVKTCR